MPLAIRVHEQRASQSLRNLQASDITCQIKTFLPCEECSEKALSHLSWFHLFLKCSLLPTNELKVRRHLLLSVYLWTRTEKESGGVKTVSQSL